ncbi:hypothetical protein F5Y17DRAFT_296701 [Xylariaceae sp. FL0594]|nr:hypothetical protein F5Y17DRAFT_296701 [Xylariaceae sp. FL0594]
MVRHMLPPSCHPGLIPERLLYPELSLSQEIVLDPPASMSPENRERGEQVRASQPALPTATQHHGHVLESYPYVPLYRYYCEVERHEEIALGLTSDHRVMRQMYEIGNAQLNASKLLIGLSAEDVGHPASSGFGSMLSSPTSSNESSDISASETLEELNRLCSNLPDWQPMSQDEQAKCLHRMQRLKRRVKDEENPRRLTSARLRKRAKTSGA